MLELDLNDPWAIFGLPTETNVAFWKRESIVVMNSMLRHQIRMIVLSSGKIKPQAGYRDATSLPDPSRIWTSLRA